MRLHSLFNDHGLFAAVNAVARDVYFGNVAATGNFKHAFQHDIFHHRTKSARAGLEAYRFFRYGCQGFGFEHKVYVVQFHKFLILFDKRIFRFGKNVDKRVYVKRRQTDSDWQTPHKLGDKTELDEVLRLQIFYELRVVNFFHTLDLITETKPRALTTLLYNFFDTDKRAAANKQNVGRIDGDRLCLRMLSAALRGNLGDGAFKNFEQRLLYAFARHVTRDGHVFRLFGDFVDFVDVNYSAFGTFDVVVGSLN